MKKFLYTCCMIGMFACNSKQQPAQEFTPTPTGLQGIQTPITTQASSSGALNPAHGQPGHRCEIAVGAPLSSAPAKTTAIQQTDTSQINKIVQELNPAHGLPGHSCEIEVGAPLK